MAEKKSFKNTLNLPKTEFSIRAKAKTKEPEILQEWIKKNLYKKSCEKNKGKEVFVLHDGPPFANGHMHMGHALNRILKDITCKVKRMSGYNVVSIPGWDCHGLPIELKVAKELGEEKVDRVQFKKRCRDYANKWIDIQREEIKRLGVVTDWENPYITMSPGYEASILKSFAVFVEKGHITRQGKTVPWCASCQTVLATAEIEYKDKKDPSCYILFPFDKKVSDEIFPEIKDKQINLLVWTTTPWTIPLNRLVALNPTAEYVLLQGKDENQAFIVAQRLADKICEKVGIEKKVLKTFQSKELQGKLVNHPYIENLKVPVILDDMVLLEDGTACVHLAPGCGPEDYFIGVKNNIEIFSPISADGKYSEGIEPKEICGMPVSDGQIWSIKKMAEKGRLFFKDSVRHSYPHCWRCHEPLIFRATDQWFCDLKKNNLVERAIEETKKLNFVPDWGKTRLTSSMASRAEWCLSRQRQWGVPITSIVCQKCDHAYISPDFIRKIAEFVKKEGVEFWDRVTLDQLVEYKILPSDFSCPKCDAGLKDFKKEMDIIDVWFESGVSHTAVKEQYPQLQIPADVFLEGSDQHRGWFQSSMLTSMVMYDKTCTKSFVTHAYVLDAQAEKMSKSKGNVVSPQKIIEKFSADILRLWVAASDFEGDIVVSDEILKNVGEVYKKIRNTCRFMISNLYDFDIEKDAVPFDQMLPLDQYALAKLQEVVTTVKDGYEKYSLTSVFRSLNEYCTNDLSSFYLDISKDRFYVEKSDGKMRRSAQTSIYYILDTLTRLIAPVLSFLAEETSDFYQKDKKESIHLQDFPQISFEVKTSNLCEVSVWNLLESVRPELLKAIEEKRESGLIKHSLEAKVTVYVDESSDDGKAFVTFAENNLRFFKDFIIVSQFNFSDSKDGFDQDGFNQTGLPWLFAKVEHADGVKCPRCWQWDIVDHEDGLCKRCQDVLAHSNVD